MIEYRALYIDDDQAFLNRSVTKLQRQPSLTVIGETSPQAGLQRLRENGRFDCLISEYELPEMDGLELLDQVRKTHPDVPFILFTGTGSEEIASRAISAGVTDYLSKHDRVNQFELLANRIQNYAERYRTQQALENENLRNKYALRAVSDVVWERDPETGEVHVSEGFTELTGYSLDDATLSFEWWIDRIHPDDRDRIRSHFQTQLAADQHTFSGEYRFRCADGTYIDVEDNGYVISDADGEPRKLIGAIRDITPRQERKQELKRYQRVIDTVAAGVFVLNDDAEFDLVNQRLTELTGYDREELLGTPVSRIVHEDSRTEVESLHEQVPPDEARPLEWQLASAADELFSVESRVTRLDDEYGGGTVWAVADMNQRERRERKLESQTNRLKQYETILETLPVGVAVLDEEATVEWVNEAFWRAFDKTEDEVTERSFMPLIEEGLIEPEIADTYLDAIRTLLSSNTDQDRVDVEFEVNPPHIDGTREYEGYIALQPLEDGDYSGTVTAFRDITERKRRQRELEQYKVAMETVPDGVFMFDETGTMIRLNDAWATTVGYDRAELENAPVRKLVDDGVIDQGTTETYLDLVRRLLSSETDDERGRFTTRIAPPDEDQEHVYEVHIGLLPYKDRFQGVAGVVRDITEKVERQRKLERENERLDQFATIVSHDLRNPLNVARGFTKMALETGDTEKLNRVMTAFDRMEGIIDDVLELARHGQTIENPSAISAKTCCEKAWEIVDTKDAQLQSEWDTDAMITADADRLQQLFENLFRNAIEHGSDDVTVHVGPDEDGFYVEDDGPGIPASDRDDIFEAGYSTSARGTGFGLHIVEQIVDAHGWQIAIGESTSGGARFEITGIDLAT